MLDKIVFYKRHWFKNRVLKISKGLSSGVISNFKFIFSIFKQPLSHNYKKLVNFIGTETMNSANSVHCLQKLSNYPGEIMQGI